MKTFELYETLFRKFCFFLIGVLKTLLNSTSGNHIYKRTKKSTSKRSIDRRLDKFVIPSYQFENRAKLNWPNTNLARLQSKLQSQWIFKYGKRANPEYEITLKQPNMNLDHSTPL